MSIKELKPGDKTKVLEENYSHQFNKDEVVEIISITDMFISPWYKCRNKEGVVQALIRSEIE